MKLGGKKERKSYTGKEERNFYLLPLSWNRDNILTIFHPKSEKKSTDDPKYAQSNSRDSITVSYRAMRVRCCLQEERQRKKVSVKQPCLLKKP